MTAFVNLVKLNKLTSSRLAKGLGLGSLQTLVKLTFGFASIKVTSVYLGPAGLALVAQLLNVINLCQGVLANGSMTALLRMGAEYTDAGRRAALFSTALRLTLILTFGCSAILLLTLPWVMPWIFAGQHHPVAYVLAAVLIPTGAAAILVNAALNSRGEMTKITVGQVALTIVGFAIFVPCAYKFGISGALIATAVTPGISLLVAFAILGRSSEVAPSDFATSPDSEALRQILRFYPMLLVHAGAGSLAPLLIRDLAARNIGLDGAGIWQATWRLSDQYLAIITASVSLYFMPRLGSLLKERMAFRREVVGTTWRVMALTLVAAIIIYSFRDWVIRIIFAPSFRQVADLMFWQLVGDVFKMGGWILAMTMTVLVRARWYIATEIIVPGTFLALANLLIDSLGAQALVISYAAGSFLSLIIGLCALRDLIFCRR